MERSVIMRIRPRTKSEYEEYDKSMGVEKWDTGKRHGTEQTGPIFKGTHVAAVFTNAYAMEQVVRVLRMCCVLYSLEAGRPITGRKKKCGTSIQFELSLIATEAEVQQAEIDTTAEAQSNHGPALTSTTPGSATQPEAGNGNQSGSFQSEAAPTPTKSSGGSRPARRKRSVN